MKDSEYNRGRVWGELYRDYDEKPQEPSAEEQSIREGRRSFAELFEARGMKGYDASEKTVAKGLRKSKKHVIQKTPRTAWICMDLPWNPLKGRW